MHVNAANWPAGPRATRVGVGKADKDEDLVIDLDKEDGEDDDDDDEVGFAEAPFQPVIVDLLDHISE